MEVTKLLKPLGQRATLGGLVSRQAATQGNAEQTSKRPMRKPTRPLNGEGRCSRGTLSDVPPGSPPGSWRRSAHEREVSAAREASPATDRSPEQGWEGSSRWR